MKVVVTGGAGFIGSNLTDGLIAAGHDVLVVDNLTTGFARHLEPAVAGGHCDVVQCDCYLEAERLIELVAGSDAIVHLAANADVRFGWDHTRRDLEQNVIATHNVLEAARLAGVRRLVFSSTGSVYGETAVIPTPEDAPYPIQTSLYGASKSAAEGYIAAYAEAGQFHATVFRFVSLLGPRYSHGHVIDFVRQLRADPGHLHMLGDGLQRKSYLHVSDCVAAMVSALAREPAFEVLNLGLDEFCTVRDSAGWIAGRLGLEPVVTYSGGDRGWIGDNPFIYLDTARIRATGWEPKFAIRDAVENTVDYLVANPWLLEHSEAAAASVGSVEASS